MKTSCNKESKTMTNPMQNLCEAAGQRVTSKMMTKPGLITCPGCKRELQPRLAKTNAAHPIGTLYIGGHAATGQPKDSNQRFSKHADGKKAAGLVRLPNRWTHPDDKQDVLDYIDKKAKARQQT